MKWSKNKLNSSYRLFWRKSMLKTIHMEAALSSRHRSTVDEMGYLLHSGVDLASEWTVLL